MFDKKIVKNIAWNLGGKFLAQVITPFFAILISRFLDPADLGLFAISAAIIAFIDIFKDLGISQAIIIEQDGNDDLISMQFTVQFILGGIIYGIIFALSGHIAFYFNNPKLKTALIIYGLMVFVYCLEYPLETFYMRNNKYSVLFYRQILPVIFYGAITYLLALKGFGVFALIIGHLSGRVMTVCLLLMKSGWKPRFYFQLNVFMRLFNLGKHILIQSVSGFLTSQPDSLIIGKLLGAHSLGFYKTGNTLLHLVPNTVTLQTQKVVFSDIAARKEDSVYYSRRYYQYFLGVGSIAFALSIISYFLSPFFIKAIMGNKWTPMIPVVQILAVSLPTGMITGINIDYAKILNFSHVYTVFGIFRSILTLSLIYIGALFSLKLAVIGWVFAGLLANTANEICFFKSQRIIKYRKYKLLFFILAWSWALFIILHA